jgi:hypothetical protein
VNTNPTIDHRNIGRWIQLNSRVSLLSFFGSRLIKIADMINIAMGGIIFLNASFSFHAKKKSNISNTIKLIFLEKNMSGFHFNNAGNFAIHPDINIAIPIKINSCFERNTEGGAS